MKLSRRVDELCDAGVPVGIAIAQAITEATESRARVEQARYAR